MTVLFWRLSCALPRSAADASRLRPPNDASLCLPSPRTQIALSSACNCIYIVYSWDGLSGVVLNALRHLHHG
jgi:hypothetical protein